MSLSSTLYLESTGEVRTQAGAGGATKGEEQGMVSYQSYIFPGNIGNAISHWLQNGKC